MKTASDVRRARWFVLYPKGTDQMKKPPKSRWRIIIAGRAAEVTARWFGEAVRRAARVLIRVVKDKRTKQTRTLPCKLITEFETGGWVGVSGERIGPATLATKS